MGNSAFFRKSWNADTEDKSREGHLTQYSDAYGVRFRVWRWLNSKFQYDLTYQPSYVKYKDPWLADSQNASRHFLSNTLTYQFNDKQSWQLSMYTNRVNAKLDTNSSQTVGGSITWRQEWPKSFYSNLTLGTSRLHNKAPYWFGLRRKMHTYSVNVQLFNPTWQYKGLMPRLVFSAQNTKSNLPTQSYQSRDAYIFIQKTF